MGRPAGLRRRGRRLGPGLVEEGLVLPPSIPSCAARRRGRAPEPGAGRGDRRPVRPAPGLHRAAAADARQPAGAALLAAVPVTLIIFDVLPSGREDLTGSPYVLRRALLDDLGLEVPGAAQVPPAFPGDAAALLEVTHAQDLEGIVLKRPASRYHPGRRTREWLKIRNIRAAEVRVGGWLAGTGTRRTWPGRCSWALPRPGGLEFAGAVGSGLSVADCAS